MKLIILLLLPAFCFSQAPKKANEIRVKNVSYSKVAMALLDAGYIIEKSDKEFQTIKTEKKYITKNSSNYIILDIRIKDSAAIITGKCGLDGQKRLGIESDSDIQNSGMKGSLLKDSFLMMERFALSLGKEVVYIKN